MLVQAAAFSALAWQTRYIGVAVPAFVGLLLLFQHGASMAQRAGRVAALSLIAAAPMALWLPRNYLATGAPTPHPPPAGPPLPMMLWSLQGVVDTLWTWVSTPRRRLLGLPYWPLFNKAVLALLAITAAFLAPVGCLLIGERWKQQTAAEWRPFWLFGGFALTYLVLFIASVSLLAGICMPHVFPRRMLIPLHIRS